MDFLKRHIFLILLITLSVTFFARNNCRNVTRIAPEVLEEPIQRAVKNPLPIFFSRNDYAYEVIPLYEYEISGLIVSKINYKAFSIEKFNRVFPIDLCLIWGENVKSGVYRNPALRFSQDCRWCNVQYLSSDIKFDFNKISNNHLLVKEPVLERKLRSLAVGDQVKLIGKLVNIKATLKGEAGTYDASSYSWNTSVIRTDSGAGACEVIYVEKIEILRKANVIVRVLFLISLYGLLGMLLWKILFFFNIIK